MSERVNKAAQQIGVNGPFGYMQITGDDFTRLGISPIFLAAWLVKNFIVKPAGEDAVHGGEILAAGGLNFEIGKPLNIYRATDGKHFESFNLDSEAFEISASDTDNPRIDRVYAALEEDADGLTELMHVNVNPAVEGSQEADVNAVVTKRNQISLVYLAGTPSANPVPPDLPVGAVKLWRMFIPANAVSVNSSSFIDERHNFLTLEEVYELVLSILAQINIIKDNKHTHPAKDVYIDQAQLDPSVQGIWITDQDAWNDISRRKSGGGGGGTTTTSRARPETLRPDVLPSNVNSGKLGASGDVVDSIPVVEYPHPRQVDFNGVIRDLSPEHYTDISLNARLANKHVNANTNSKQLNTPISIGGIIVEETDGGGVYELQGATSPTNISHGVVGNRRICPRNSTIIDLIGVGDFAGEPTSTLLEFDTVSGTFTPKDMEGDVPPYGVTFAVSLGNGKVLMAGPGGTAVSADKGRIKWFLLDTATGEATAISGGPGDTSTSALGEFNIMGDLVVGGVNGIVSLIIWGEGINTLTNVAQYEYHINSNSFTQLAIIGTGPNWFRLSPKFQHMDACVLRENELVLVDGAGSPAHTFVFNHQTKSWREYNISQPFYEINPFTNGLLWGLSLSNVNGKVHLLSGSTTLWELSIGATAVWKQIRVPAMEPTGFPKTTRFGSMMTGMLTNGLPMGTGYVVGGGASSTSAAIDFLRQVWKFKAGGVVASSCGGATGITLGEGATSATIRIPNNSNGYLPWPVGRYIITFKGFFLPGQVRALVSFVNGGTPVEIPVGKITAITSSDNNPIRELHVIITGTANQKPCISEINETFEQDGGPGLTEVVVRFNPPIGTWYLKQKVSGEIVLESTVEESTDQVCYLAKIVRSGSSAPTVLNIINKPLVIREYRILDSSAVIENDFPVAPDHISAKKIDGSGFYKDCAAPAAPFNGNIDTSALTSSGETAVVLIVG